MKDSKHVTEREKNETLLLDGKIDELPLIKPDKLCNGRKKGKRAYCKRPAGWGTQHPREGRCKLHGGNNVRGVAHVRFKSGKYSKSLASSLLQKYEDARSDPTLLSLQEEIAVCDARIKTLFEALRSLPSGKQSETTVTALRRKITAAKNAVGKGLSGAEFLAILTQLEPMIADIANERQIWKEIGYWMDRRQRLVDSENKRMIKSETMVSASEISLLVGGILSVLRENIKDQKTMHAIGRGIGRLLPEPDRLNIIEAEAAAPARYW